MTERTPKMQYGGHTLPLLHATAHSFGSPTQLSFLRSRSNTTCVPDAIGNFNRGIIAR